MAKKIEEPEPEPQVIRRRTRPHLTQRGVFESDKYDWCPKGFMPLKFTDKMAQPYIWQYAQDRREVDKEFQEDVHTALARLSYYGPGECCPSKEGRVQKFFRNLTRSRF